jgi:hypothetical protein
MPGFLRSKYRLSPRAPACLPAVSCDTAGAFLQSKESGMIEVSVRADLVGLQRSLSALAQTQVPYATATALTALAKRVQAAEKISLSTVFDRPTPFTLGAIGVRAARKDTLQAMVFVRDTAAGYLSPYEFDGPRKLNGRALLNPKAIGLNRYGNLPKGALAKLKARPDIFIGPVKTKAGSINGVWQRPAANAKAGARRGGNSTGKLKLLIRFADGKPVPRRLGYRDRAKKIVDGFFKVEFDAAMARAMASARR